MESARGNTGRGRFAKDWWGRAGCRGGGGGGGGYLVSLVNLHHGLFSNVPQMQNQSLHLSFLFTSFTLHRPPKTVKDCYGCSRSGQTEKIIIIMIHSSHVTVQHSSSDQNQLPYAWPWPTPCTLCSQPRSFSGIFPSTALWNEAFKCL